MTRTTIETHPTGTFFDFAAPTADMIHVEDIARSLSMQCRFGGFVERFYSVAEHALLVSRLVREAGHGPALQFAALHHDSHEAYVGDLPTPVKNYLLRAAPAVWDTLVNAIDCAIEQRFDIFAAASAFHHPDVKTADEQALSIEAAELKVSRGVGWTVKAERPTGAVACFDPQWAEHMFLTRHYALAGDLAMLRLGGGK